LTNPRIISGTAKGFRLKPVPGDTTRPITDRVKEALFNILGIDVEESAWLDLFAGTGSVGIEALSRGASFARFIDLNRQAVETIQYNLARTGLKEKSQVVRNDAFHVLKDIPDREFEYIYIAPPQYKDLWLKSMHSLDANPQWLSQDGWVIVQIDPVEYRKEGYTHFREIEQRKYGSTLLIFYEWNSPQTQNEES